MYELIHARNYTRVTRRPTLIVIHTMEAPEKPGTARAVASWFAGANAPQASAHYCVDSSEVIQCVEDELIAWHAPGANARGIGVEHAGYASQSTGEWDDEESRKILRRSAALVAELCTKWGIVPNRLDPEQVAAGLSGICGHFDVTRAFPGKGTHTDPGPNFPWNSYIVAVRTEIARPHSLLPEA
jgi:N-acetyl-anhydromuramyl-L-alanine amidase AmpD